MSTTGHSANHVSLPSPISQLSLTSDSLNDNIASQFDKIALSSHTKKPLDRTIDQ
jgi:hypothetical protein